MREFDPMAFSETNQQLADDVTHEAFGEVNVRRDGNELEVMFTLLMEPEREGWQTGVAIDASASMKELYGKVIDPASIPADAMKRLEQEGHLQVVRRDGRESMSLKSSALTKLQEWGVTLKRKPNLVQEQARKFLAYLAETMDEDGGTTLVYWACGDAGNEFEVAGDFTHKQCESLEIKGPREKKFGDGTYLMPALQYFVDRFTDSAKGIYIFVTDGTVDDFEEVKGYSMVLAEQIASGQRNPVKFVLLGLGPHVNPVQMAELDDLETGEVDLWDYKLAGEISNVLKIFAEVVNTNVLVPGEGSIVSAGQTVASFPDGVPCSISFRVPASATEFEFIVNGQSIQQKLIARDTVDKPVAAPADDLLLDFE
jgi:hypothetical protein